MKPTNKVHALAAIGASLLVWLAARGPAPVADELVVVPFAVDAVRAPGVTQAQVLAYYPVPDDAPARLSGLRVSVEGTLLHAEQLDVALHGDPEYGAVNALIERLPEELAHLHRARRWFAAEDAPTFAGPEALLRREEIALRVSSLRTSWAAGAREPFVQLSFPLPLDQVFLGDEPIGSRRAIAIELDWVDPAGTPYTSVVEHEVRWLGPVIGAPTSFQAVHGATEVHPGDLHVHSCHGEAANACAPSSNCAAESLQTSGSFTYAQLKTQYQALGIDWITGTDHSYCIVSDPEFAAIQAEIGALNEPTFLAMADIELSSEEEGSQTGGDSANLLCLFGSPPNHMGAHGISTRKPGGSNGFAGFCSGVAGFQANAAAVRADDGYPIVNHPSASSFGWNSVAATDGIEAGEMHGVEIWNGASMSGQGGAVGAWVGWLLAGRILYAYSGSDTHDAAFAFGANHALLTDEPFTIENVEAALKGGRAYVSDGPFLAVEVELGPQTIAMGTIHALAAGGPNQPALVRAHYDFGAGAGTLQLFEGTVGAGSETVLCTSGTLSGAGTFECAATVSGSSASYYRAYASGSGVAYSNPVFFRPGLGAVTAYCTAKTNSQGCVPTMSWNGLPSASLDSPFDVVATNVLNQKSGLLFYGYAQAAIPFQGGVKCIPAPTRRTPIQGSGGNPPPDDCTGVYTFDFRARIQSGVDPSLVPGTAIYAQYWSRDPQVASTTGLTDAVCFTIQP